MVQATAQRPAPAVGDPAPDVAIPGENGAPIQLSTLWTGPDKGLALVFLRHFGCVFCKEHARQLRADQQKFTDLGYAIATIGVGKPERAAKFKTDESLPFPVFGDWERVSYDAYGLGHQNGAELLNLGTIVAGLRATMAGNMQGRSTGDPSQLPGTFIIDPAGIVRFSRPATHAGDIVSTKDLLAAIAGFER